MVITFSRARVRSRVGEWSKRTRSVLNVMNLK